MGPWSRVGICGVVVCLAIMACGVAAQAAYLYKFDGKWGSYGTGDGNFYHPVGVAYDSTGKVYVSDYGNNRIQKFRDDLTFLATWGTSGINDGQMKNPTRIAIGQNKWLYVPDKGNYRVQRFQFSGFFLGKWGSYGTANGQFKDPKGVGVDKLGDVYVVDSSRENVQKFDELGGFITAWGSYGSGDSKFNNVADVAIDKNLEVYVTDYNNKYVKVFDATGTFLRKFGGDGIGDGQFKAPLGITCGPGGYVYVTDNTRHDVQKFTAQGTFVVRIGLGKGSAEYQMNGPTDVAIDPQNRVLVVEYENNRLQRFRLNKPPTPPATVVIKPASPVDTDDLLATASGATDVDADPLAYRYQWYKSTNGTNWSKGPAARKVPASQTTVAQYWKCMVRATDGLAASGQKASATVQIAAVNHPPTAPSTVTIAPTEPLDTEDLEAFASGATDIDGDTLTYKYQWYRSVNGTTWVKGPTTKVVGASQTVIGQYWKVGARAHDGKVTGAQKMSAVVIIS